MMIRCRWLLVAPLLFAACGPGEGAAEPEQAELSGGAGDVEIGGDVSALASEGCTSFAGCTSVQASGLSSCMSASMSCQVIASDRLPAADGTTVVVTGGGYSGSPTIVGWRCGTAQTAADFVEVYVDDVAHTWPSPPVCVPRGGAYTLQAGHTYAFRGPSVVGATPLPITLAAFGPTSLAATAVAWNAVRLDWTDAWTARDGVRVERSDRRLYPTPTPVLPIGAFGAVRDANVEWSLFFSALVFCGQRGFTDVGPYTITGPVSAAYSSWTGSGWYSTGNNTVFMLTNLECAMPWGEIGYVLGGTGATYLDGTVGQSSRFAYRVRSYRGATYSEYSPVAVATTPVRPPLSVSLALSGTVLVATAVNGTAPYGHVWYRYLPCSSGGGDTSVRAAKTARGTASAALEAPCGAWLQAPSRAAPNEIDYSSRYDYRVDVTDAVGATASATYAR